MDIYLDDDGRPSWDTMIVQHEVLEHGDFSQRQQVVRWIRKFPFSFISGGSEGSICCLCCQQCGAIQCLGHHIIQLIHSAPDREYVIGKRVFRIGDALYGITKVRKPVKAPGIWKIGVSAMSGCCCSFPSGCRPSPCSSQPLGCQDGCLLQVTPTLFALSSRISVTIF